MAATNDLLLGGKVRSRSGGDSLEVILSRVSWTWTTTTLRGQRAPALALPSDLRICVVGAGIVGTSGALHLGEELQRALGADRLEDLPPVRRPHWGTAMAKTVACHGKR